MTSYLFLLFRAVDTLSTTTLVIFSASWHLISIFLPTFIVGVVVWADHPRVKYSSHAHAHAHTHTHTHTQAYTHRHTHTRTQTHTHTYTHTGDMCTTSHKSPSSTKKPLATHLLNVSTSPQAEYYNSPPQITNAFLFPLNMLYYFNKYPESSYCC